MVSCVDQVLGMTINGDEGDDITFAESGIPNPYLQVISFSLSIHLSSFHSFLSTYGSISPYLHLFILLTIHLLVTLFVEQIIGYKV